VHTFKDGYEWDEQKAEANLAKHGVDFAHVFAALEDERAVTLHDERSDEERYVVLGMDAFGRLLVVVHTWRDDVVRVISARKATKTEARLYAAANP
jgi:uncharacterized DUF497 family protein